jgi:hypothetical protein
MTRRVTVADLLAAIALAPAEAVAIVQQLIHGRPAATLHGPLGPPTAETVCITADGSVICQTSDPPFAVSDLAALLESMLPAGKTGNDLSLTVPGALRYMLARARLEVDAPPFDSVDEFSRAVARHERGDRAQMIQRVIARANAAGCDGQLDRRRTDPAVAHLRRQLRVADARVYDQQLAIDTLSAMSSRPPRSGKGFGLAAGIAIGLTVVGAGQLMRDAVPEPVRPAASVSAPPAPVPAVSRPSEPDRQAVAVKPAVATAPAKRSVRPAAPNNQDREPARPHRFRWLKTRFAFRSDPL